MAVAPSEYVDREQLAREIERAKKRLGPQVVRLRYSVGEDTSEEPAVFFRIVLTDLASKEEALVEVIKEIVDLVLEELRPYERGMRAYFSFRSQSEQASRDHIDLAWA